MSHKEELHDGLQPVETMTPAPPEWLQGVKDYRHLKDDVWEMKLGDNYHPTATYKDLCAYHKANGINDDSHHIVPDEMLDRLETGFNRDTAPAIGLNRDFHRGTDSLTSAITREMDGARGSKEALIPSEAAGIMYGVYQEGEMHDLNQIVSNVTGVDTIPTTDAEWEAFEDRVYNDWQEAKALPPAPEAGLPESTNVATSEVSPETNSEGLREVGDTLKAESPEQPLSTDTGSTAPVDTGSTTSVDSPDPKGGLG